jgi:lipopolysaccharide assembly outer membrane protein LptD (OstA)
MRARPLAFVLAVALAVVAAGSPARALDFTHIAGFDRIESDIVNWNLETGAFSLPHPFVASRENSDISADRATGNSRQRQLHAEGHVVVHQTEPLKSSLRAAALTQKPSTLTCDVLDVDGVRKLYVAVGNVHFTQENREATADRGTLDDANHHLHMEGHVHIRDKEQTLESDVLDYDTLTGDLSAKGNVTIQAPVETAAPAEPASATPKPKKH